MQIKYANQRVEKFFTDFSLMQRKLNPDWVRTIKKQLNAFKAADMFQDFLALGLWHPEPLEGNGKGKNKKWSIHVTKNVRLVFEPNETGKVVTISEEVIIEGVVDYHGSNESWYIP